MRVLLMEISDLENAAVLLTSYYTIQKLRGISNEILCIPAGQGDAKVQEVRACLAACASIVKCKGGIRMLVFYSDF